MHNATPAGYRYYTFFGSLFVAVLLITNVVAPKLVPIGPFVFTAWIFLFPISYIFGDILTEVYWYAKTKKIIWYGFIASFLMAIYFMIIVALPTVSGSEFQNSFSVVLGQVPRIVVASLLAYLAWEFMNSYVMSKMKVKQKWKNFWTRAVASTIVWQWVDTIIFVFIALYGVVPTDVLITTIRSWYLFKVVYEIIISPFTVIVVRRVKKKEWVDTFDYHETYAPF